MLRFVCTLDVFASELTIPKSPGVHRTHASGQKAHERYRIGSYNLEPVSACAAQVFDGRVYFSQHLHSKRRHLWHRTTSTAH